MRILILASLALTMTGCAITKGTMFDGRICTFATDKDVQAMVDLAIALAPPSPEQAGAVAAQTLAKVSATALCEHVRALEAKQAAKQ